MYRVTRALTRAPMVCALALMVSQAVCPGARAGRYHVYSCRTPTEQVAPSDGWSASTSVSSATVVARDTCSTGGALVAGLADGVKHEVGSSATWTFAAPVGEGIAGATLWRAGEADGGSAANAYYEFWMAGPEDIQNSTNVFDECVSSFSCPLGGVGSSSEARSSANIVTVSREHLQAHIFLHAACAGETKFLCPEGRNNPNGYAAVVYLYAADILLEQTSQPTVVPGSVGGELATASTVSGLASLTFQAEDAGSGVYRAMTTVDEKAVGSTVLDSNGGHCVDVGHTTDGLPAFLYLRPCAPTVSADVPLDTTQLSDGVHHLVVTVTNAAGGSAVVVDRKIDVANQAAAPSTTTSGSTTSGSSASGSGATSTTGSSTGATTANAGTSLASGSASPGPPNGSPATTLAVLAARWRSTVGSTAFGRWGHGQTIVGRLTTNQGTPISGADVQVSALAASQGAVARSISDPHTDAQGRFTVRLSAGSASEQVIVAYRAHIGDLVPAATQTLALSVPASLTLKVAPRISHQGGTIRFSGLLHGGPLPSGGKQLVLQARAPGSGWRTFQAISSDRHGRFHSTYRFRLPGPITYGFRVLSPHEADFPFAAGRSNVVTVRER